MGVAEARGQSADSGPNSVRRKYCLSHRRAELARLRGKPEMDEVALGKADSSGVLPVDDAGYLDSPVCSLHQYVPEPVVTVDIRRGGMLPKQRAVQRLFELVQARFLAVEMVNSSQLLDRNIDPFLHEGCVDSGCRAGHPMQI